MLDGGIKDYGVRLVFLDNFSRNLERFRGGMRGVGEQLDKLDADFNKMFTGAERWGQRMMLLGTGIVGGIGVLTYAGIKYNATVEQLQAKLKIFLGTQEKVNEAYEWASRITLRVPMTRRDLVPIITLLEQYGFAYDKWTESVLNAAAATKRPGESIRAQAETIAIAFGRIKSGQVGQGLLMLRRAGLVVENAGIKFKKSGEPLDEPRVVLEKLKKYLDTDFKGAAEAFGDTWEGQIMKIKSLTIRALGAGVLPVFDELKVKLVKLTDFIASPAGQAKMKEWAKTFGEMLTESLELARQISKVVLPVLKAVLWVFEKTPAPMRVTLALLPLVGGAALIAAGKIGKLVFWLRQFKKTSAGCAATRAGCAEGFGAMGEAAKKAAPKVAGFTASLARFATIGGPVAAAAASIAAWFGIMFKAGEAAKVPKGFKPGEAGYGTTPVRRTMTGKAVYANLPPGMEPVVIKARRESKPWGKSGPFGKGFWKGHKPAETPDLGGVDDYTGGGGDGGGGGGGMATSRVPGSQTRIIHVEKGAVVVEVKEVLTEGKAKAIFEAILAEAEAA